MLAWDVVRYEGEPVAIVAAVDLDTARLAAAKVAVDYEVLEPVTDAAAGEVLRAVRIRHGEMTDADVVVTGSYEVGMQDQAFLGPESGLAIPAEDGGVDLHVATQWLHVDRDQVCASLSLPPELVRLHLAGVGGAFGGREDVSIQIHACLLALRTRRPVKMVYSREESFYGHVHRHPAWLRYEHGANRDGELVYVKAEVLLDGGAYTSSSPAVVGNAALLRGRAVPRPRRRDRRPRRVHQQPAVRRDARVRRRPGGRRARGADGPAGRGAGHGSGRAAASATRCRPATA